MSAEVTQHHRLQTALCHQNLLWDNDDPYPRQRIWIKNGDTNHLRDDEKAWPVIAQALADIEASALAAAPLAPTGGGAAEYCQALDDMLEAYHPMRNPWSVYHPTIEKLRRARKAGK